MTSGSIIPHVENGAVQLPYEMAAGPPHRENALRKLAYRAAQIFLILAAFFSGYHILRIGSLNFTVADLMIVAAFGTFLILGRLNTRPFAELTPIWMISVLMIFGGLFISSLLNGDIMRWFIVTVQYSMGWLFIPILLMALPVRFCHVLIVSFLLGITVMELSGILATIFLDFEITSKLFSNEFITGSGRLGSFAGEPNWNGQLIAYAIITLIYCWSKRLLPIWAFLFITPILFWALLLCASATGFIATIIATSVALTILGWRYQLGFMAILGAGAAIALLSGISSPEIFEKRVGTALASGDINDAGTFTGRAALIEEAWDMADDTILVGVGVDQFRKISPTRQPVHNLYLLMWTEGGLLAFAGLIMLFGTMVYLVISRFAVMRAEVAFALPMVFIYAVYAMSSPHMFVRFGVLPVMIALAAIYGRSTTLPQYR